MTPCGLVGEYQHFSLRLVGDSMILPNAGDYIPICTVSWQRKPQYISACSWQYLFLLPPPPPPSSVFSNLSFFPSSSPSQKLCAVLPTQWTANNLSLLVFLGLPLMIYILLVMFGHNLCHLLYISCLFLVVFPHFAYHATCRVVRASVLASTALSCAGLLITYWSFNIFPKPLHQSCGSASSTPP